MTALEALDCAIDCATSEKALGQLLGVAQQTVAAWRKNGVPKKHIKPLIRYLTSKGVALSVDVFLK